LTDASKIFWIEYIHCQLSQLTALRIEMQGFDQTPTLIFYYPWHQTYPHRASIMYPWILNPSFQSPTLKLFMTTSLDADPTKAYQYPNPQPD
jgi:hypothetical protein